MKFRKPSQTPETAVDEREWQVQERAMRDARAGGPVLTEDAAALRYAAIDRAVRSVPMHAPPLDFAAGVALAAEQAREEGDNDLRRLSQVLIALLGLSGGVVATLYGGAWIRAIADAIPAGAGSWLVLVALCALMHWSLERWREHHRPLSA